MEQLIITIVGGLAVLLIAGWLGIGGSPVRIIHAGRTSKKWKWVILVSWLIIIVGIVIFLSNFPQGGFNSPLTGLGFLLVFLGLIGLGIGKIGSWFHRD